MRQFLVDDKGMVLIACYGLVAHENDSERATRCAMDISNDLTKIGITSSAGVTTGEVYCGLVGGDTRWVSLQPATEFSQLETNRNIVRVRSSLRSSARALLPVSTAKDANMHLSAIR